MLLRSIAATAILLTSASAVHALEGKALLDKYLSSPSMQKSTITWGNIQEENSNSFILTNVEIVKKDTGEKSTIANVVVRGLIEDGGRLTFDTITLNNVKGTTDDGGNIGIANITSTTGSFPTEIWEDGLTPEEKRERISFGNFTVNGFALAEKGTNVTIDNVAMTNADIPLDFRFEPDQIAEAVGEPAAPLKFDQFAVTGLSGSNEGVTFGMNTFSISNVNMPTTINATIYEWMQAYSAMSITGITTSLGPTPVFELQNIAATISPADGDGTYSSSTTMDGMVVNLDAIPDPQAKAVAQQLGYSKVEGSMSGIGTYNPTSGQIVLSDMIIKLKDMFDLSMDYSVSGYTPEVASKVQEAQLEMQKGKDPMQAFGAILADLAVVKLDSLKLALTDQSLTGRLLDFQATQMGTTGDQLAAGAPMMIGLGMGGLNMPELTDMVTSAVGTFLKDKGTLTIEATPSEPVAIMNVVLAGQADPTKVPGLINLQVSAK